MSLLGSKLTNRFSVYDDDDSKDLLTTIVKESNEWYDAKMTKEAIEMKDLLSHMKSRLSTMDDLTAQEALDRLADDPRVQDLFKPENEGKRKQLMYTFHG